MAWRVVTKAALDSIPVLRRNVMDALRSTTDDLETPVLATAIGYPTPTTRRALEELQGHGVVLRTVRGEGSQADRWRLMDWAREAYESCLPETSEDPFSNPNRVFDDISGTQTTEGKAA